MILGGCWDPNLKIATERSQKEGLAGHGGRVEGSAVGLNQTVIRARRSTSAKGDLLWMPHLQVFGHPATVTADKLVTEVAAIALMDSKVWGVGDIRGKDPLLDHCWLC